MNHPSFDSIHLKGIRGYGYTGALPEEQVLGQWFEVDLTLWLDLSTAGQSDRLEDTLDYREVISFVQQTIRSSRFALLERLAANIAEGVLAISDGKAPILQVRVALTKLAPPIPDFDGRITIEILRKRN
jgi:dihydroneopterin aldolase